MAKTSSETQRLEETIKRMAKEIEWLRADAEARAPLGKGRRDWPPVHPPPAKGAAPPAKEPLNEFNAYQAQVENFWGGDVKGVPSEVFCSLALCGEAGELAEKIKKGFRDRGGEFDEDARRAVQLELGDTLFYLAKQAELFGFTLSEVANANVHKLESRRSRGVLRGSGDDR